MRLYVVPRLRSKSPPLPVRASPDPITSVFRSPSLKRSQSGHPRSSKLNPLVTFRPSARLAFGTVSTLRVDQGNSQRSISRREFLRVLRSILLSTRRLATPVTLMGFQPFLERADFKNKSTSTGRFQPLAQFSIDPFTTRFSKRSDFAR